VHDAAAALAFYVEAFGAVETMRLTQPDGTTVGHAEIAIGGARVMLSDEFPEMDVVSPRTLGGTPMSMTLYVADVDVAFDRAVRAGAAVLRPVANQFYGDRSGSIADPFGYKWHLSTHVEDLSADELQRRAEEQAGPADQ
jgi:PhnB protein